LKENSGDVKDGKDGRGMPGGVRKKRADRMMEEAEARLRWVRERGATGTATSARYTDPDMANYFMYSDDVYPAFEADEIGYYFSKVLYVVTLHI
jgi:hypothetical protein